MVDGVGVQTLRVAHRKWRALSGIRDGVRKLDLRKIGRNLDVLLGHSKYHGLVAQLGGASTQELASVMRQVDAMSGSDFEQLVAALLRRDGWLDVEVAGGAGDRGADVFARHPLGGRLVVQAKRYSPARAVPSGQVQMFLGTHQLIHEASHSMFVTTSRLTNEGLKLCAAGGVVPVERGCLEDWLAGRWNSLGLRRVAPKPFLEEILHDLASGRTPASQRWAR